ncbi:1-(5-phosphoribosyl)-5-[(5-phosphoribosylamino)methylideneamino]imidazole-4-carboxamide isomerase [Parvularcula dongshanensis]|uniref:1-(5-phosphoribosyl)-5-[(5-phosphoribosylamino)methylideneamino] imidazole-4-carboxamide isomerase n=1 Tax=Parvularcula dongshanensis TaxID=1173995 RepID=A0A840I6B5_9PROT|nr:1-(5-phosphoribosyl)-5-[(5-phosphoribosylamino)methylideneamino]imidazole-4-carboxamide isomerase [Parvularcula dongshanensis]MBB4659972.1 phosphoribosylformimino-5-aminoimidazole carboxamide ribotide isomerase [Parvularcula dongshanensis]
MTFELWPAIDLKGGECVRLLYGDMERSTTYAKSPAAQAWRFRDAGFDRLHVVDLDGAFAGAPANAEAVQAILYETDAKVQLGGGIRDRETVDRWLDLGITRVILGTAAVKDPALVKGAAKAHEGRIVVGIDARDGLVATEGWAQGSEMTAIDLGRRFEDAGVAAIVFTDIGRDGALTGVNVEATAELARALTIPVLASGGVKDADDIKALALHKADGVAGAILGRSLYEGTIDPSEAQGIARTA